jgi:hypothetical protein
LRSPRSSELSPISANLPQRFLIKSWNRSQVGLVRKKQPFRGVDAGNDKGLDGQMAKSASGEQGAGSEHRAHIQLGKAEGVPSGLTLHGVCVNAGHFPDSPSRRDRAIWTYRVAA